MTEKKLEALFTELNEEEINMIENSDINTECDIDPKHYSVVLAKVRAKAHDEIASIPVVNSKEKESVILKTGNPEGLPVLFFYFLSLIRKMTTRLLTSSR